MKYILDETLVFRSDDGAMWHVDNEGEKLIISPIVSRLFSLLLDKQGEILTRDDIMYQVWSMHGLEPSGNSLNQYISQLRKNMKNFGFHENVIRTLPRVGFVFDESISIVKAETCTEINAVYIDELNNKDRRTNGKPKGRNKKNVIGLLVFLILVFIAVMIPSVIKSISARFETTQNIINPKMIGLVNSCKVYWVGDTVFDTDTISLVQKVFDDNDLTCADHNMVLFYAQAGVRFDNPGRIFISLCKENNGILTSCESKLFNSWM